MPHLKFAPILVAAIVLMFLVSPNPVRLSPDLPRVSGDPPKEAAELPPVREPVMTFEENRGQFGTPVRFHARARGYEVYLTDQAAHLVLATSSRPASGAAPAPRTIQLSIPEAEPAQPPHGLGSQPAITHYLTGTDSSGWRTNIRSYERVVYPEILPGVDLVFYGPSGNLEFDFVLAAGKDPHQLRIQLEGADALYLEPGGEVRLELGTEVVRLKKPLVYQGSLESGELVAAGYRRIDERTIGLEIGDYDPSRSLIVDPTFVYSTYLGGRSSDESWDIYVDPAGNSYVVGVTESDDFPIVDPLSPDRHPNAEVFLSRFDSSGMLVSSTYLGGAERDSGFGVAVDQQGFIYLSGSTSSADFPTTAGVFRTTRSAASYDLFVSKLNPAASGLVYSTLIGGTQNSSYPVRIAPAPDGSVWGIGTTGSADFPTANPHQDTLKGASDVVLFKLSPDGKTLPFSTYLGGTRDEIGAAIAVDGMGRAWITGRTDSSNFPLLQPLQAWGGQLDAFAARFSAAGALLFSSYLGGSGQDRGADVVVDTTGNAYLTGTTASDNFPTTPDVLYPQNFMHSQSVFVSKIAANGGSLLFSTFLGSSKSDEAAGIALDSEGNVHLTGWTVGTDFPQADPVQMAYGNFGTGYIFASAETFVCKLSQNGSVIPFSTFLGGWASDYGRAIGTDSSGNVYVTGITNSDTNFPIINAFQPSLRNPWEVFLTKIDTTPAMGVGLPPIPDQPWTRRGRSDSNGNGIPDPEDDTTMLVRDGGALRVFSSRYPGHGESTTGILSDRHPLTGAYQTLTRTSSHYSELTGELRLARTVIAHINGYDENLRPISAEVKQIKDDRRNGTLQTQVGGASVLDQNQDGLYDSVSVKLPDMPAFEVDLIGVDVNDDGHSDFLTLPWGLVQTSRFATAADPQVFLPLGDTNGDGIPDAPAFDFDQDGNPDPDLLAAPFLSGPAHPTLEHELYFAQFGDGLGLISSQITLVNMSEEEEVEATIYLRDDSGNPLQVDLNGILVNGETQATVPAGGIAVLKTDGEGPISVGSVVVRSQRPLSGTILFGGLTGLAGVANSLVQPRGFEAPMESVAGKRRTGVAIMNLEEHSVNISFELSRNNGSLLASAAGFSLPPGGHTSLYFDQIGWTSPLDYSNLSAVLKANSSGRVAAMVLSSEASPDELVTQPVAGYQARNNAGATFPVRFVYNVEHALYFPQFVDGAAGSTHVSSRIVLVNLDPWLIANATVRLKDDDGEPMTVDLNGQEVPGEFNVAVPVGGVVVLDTDGLGPIQVGAATVTSDRPLEGVITYRSLGSAGVAGSTVLSNGFNAPVESLQANGISTGIAVMNLEEEEVEVDFDLHNANGVKIAGSPTLLLKENGHSARMIYDIVWSPPVNLNNLVGSIRARSSARLAATVIRTQFSRGQLATLPVVPRLPPN